MSFRCGIGIQSISLTWWKPMKQLDWIAVLKLIEFSSPFETVDQEWEHQIWCLIFELCPKCILESHKHSCPWCSTKTRTCFVRKKTVCDSLAGLFIESAPRFGSVIWRLYFSYFSFAFHRDGFWMAQHSRHPPFTAVVVAKKMRRKEFSAVFVLFHFEGPFKTSPSLPRFYSI